MCNCFNKHSLQEFNLPATFCGCAPGRVNLIGEHTDYNDGFVLPMALPMCTVVLGTASDDDANSNLCEVVTLMKECGDEEQKRVAFQTVGLEYKESDAPKWANYVKGVVANFHESLEGKGFKALIATNVPIGKTNPRISRPILSEDFLFFLMSFLYV